MLANASIDMKVFREETFGPAIPLFRFDTDAEAIKLANDTEYGLAAYFWTQARPRPARSPLAPRSRPGGACRHALASEARRAAGARAPAAHAVRASRGARRPPGPAPRPAPCWPGDRVGRPPRAASKAARMSAPGSGFWFIRENFCS